MARTVRTTAVAVILTATAAGCSGGGDPGSGAMSPEPTPSTTTAEPSSSPSPSASADGEKPERPAAMEQHDAEGAAAAAEYFLSLRSYIMKTGDTAEWEAMSHQACDFCASGLAQARQIAERGDVFEGGEITARTVQRYERDAATGIWPLDVEMDESATRILDAGGDVLLEAERSVEVNRVEMGLVDGDWVVVTVASVPEG